MRFLFPAITLGLLLSLPVSAGDDGLTGNWKFSIVDSGQQVALWIMKLQSKDGKITASAEPLKGAPKVEVKEIKQTGDTITLKLQGTVVDGGQKLILNFEYEGKLPKPGAKKILGSFSQGNAVMPALLEATSAKNGFELDREILLRSPSDPKSMTAIFDLLLTAKANKVDAKDLQDWIDSSLKSAALYGPRYQMRHQIRLLDFLQDEKDYPTVTVTVANRIAKSVDAKAAPEMQLRLFSVAADILRKGGKKDDAAALDVRIDKLEGVAYADYEKNALDFKLAKVAPRKNPTGRGVLVELFTGAQCPPCVAADMAFDGLEKSYSPADVVLLQYHLHIPRPDPLANFDSDARYEYYQEVKKARGTPSSLFNGKPAASGGGGRDDAGDKYKEYCDVVNKLLPAPDTGKLSGIAMRTGDKLKITAKVQDLTMPGNKVRLRLVVVEDWVRYQGSNGLQYHHRVVRTMPGGAKGFTLKAKDFEHTEEVDLEKLRKTLNKYLDEDYRDGSRPMRLRNLHVVAFVQDDDSTEVLHAIDMPVRESK